MGLPPEIWCQICHLVAEQSSPVFISFGGRPAYNAPRSSKELLSTKRNVLAFASTCRWMYETTTSIFYRKNSFHVFDFFRDTKKFLTSIGPSKLNLITSLSLTHNQFTELPWQKISTMAAVKKITVFYINMKRATLFYRDMERVSTRLQDPGTPRVDNIEAVIDYGNFVKSISLYSPIEGELQYSYDDYPWTRDFDYLSVVEESNRRGYLWCTRFSWGCVKARLYEDIMVIEIER